MTTDKDFKRVVRTRMRKTGESYTAARATLLKKRPRKAAAPAEPQLAAPPPDYAALAGMSDAAVEAKTGRTWASWVATLDEQEAHTWKHGDIARFVHEEFGVPGWWTQTVTVGYERIKGLREIGQRRSGVYEASRSKTIVAPVGEVFRAFTDARTRKKWLPEVKITLGALNEGRSIRFKMPGGAPVAVWLDQKAKEKVSVSVTHGKLQSRDEVDHWKAYWGERLSALAEVLTGR